MYLMCVIIRNPVICGNMNVVKVKSLKCGFHLVVLVNAKECNEQKFEIIIVYSKENDYE